MSGTVEAAGHEGGPVAGTSGSGRCRRRCRREPPTGAGEAVSSCRSALRRALPGAELRTQPPGYALRVGQDDLDA
ncbi:hypothetical protein [Nonomuraea sp. SYSU D8015]|uniref:hypothetical protein n=1 Tax=Nonomuraea sp. SYSU D8015 TaxID=2593644 RepID=UPI001660C2E2|nr:hypothetical protein [Nonomuraea sp. SYSU D8015]